MENNERLFFKVWRNIYLRVTIFKYLKMYREEVDFSIYDSHTLVYGKIKNADKIENLVYLSDYMINGSKHLLKFKNLKRIKFTNNSLAQIQGDSIPSTIKEVIYPIGNNQISTDLSDLPTSVISVKNVCLIKKQMTSLGQLQPYSKSISIPKTLKSISFGKNSKFNITLGKFRKENGICNGIICNFPSESLETLDLGVWFNNNSIQLEQGVFSDGIKTLNLGSYNQLLEENIIPKSVTNLTLYHPNEYLIGRNVIPDSVEQLHLKYKGLPNTNEMKLTPNSLPSSITFLTLDTSKFPIENGSIPNNVVYLCLGDTFDIKITKGMLPSSSESISPLKTLIVPDSQSLVIEEGSLVNSITRLVFKQKARSYSNINEIGWNQSIDIEFFPNKLISLLLGDGFNQFLKPGILPPTLLELRLGRSYNYMFVIGSLPSKLQKLIFSEDSDFNQPIDEIGILPPLLTHLEFNNKFSQPIKTIGILPSTLSTLILPREYDPLIPKEVIPKIEDIRYLNFF